VNDEQDMDEGRGRWLRTPAGLEAHVVERQGCPLHFWTGGRPGAPWVALLHGATMDHRMFNAQVPALLADYRVLVWDARGQGQSQPMGDAFSLELCAEDLVAIMDHLGAGPAVLVGQSLGGYIAQVAYLRHPRRVQAMAVVGTTCIALPYSTWEIVALRASLPLFRLWPYGSLQRTTARATAIRPDVQAYAREAIGQIGRQDFIAIWQAISVAVDRRGLPGHRIQVPLLLTHGQHDRTGSIRRQAPAWAAYEPDVHYVVIPDAGHNANQDNPEFFNRVLLDWLRERVPQEGRDSPMTQATS
jgi:pimeloyl-ACP methyl ester carboxylesterase